MEQSEARQAAYQIIGDGAFAIYDPNRATHRYLVGREKWLFYSIFGSGNSWEEALSVAMKFLNPKQDTFKNPTQALKER